jgi:hypothetical protein
VGGGGGSQISIFPICLHTAKGIVLPHPDRAPRKIHLVHVHVPQFSISADLGDYITSTS